MKSRGRPKTDDILTPREWEVLDLLRAGLSNREIAAHLGISYDGARYHVSEILSRLGVERREEAARWQPQPSRRWSIFPQLTGLSTLRAAIAGSMGHNLALVAAIPLTVLAIGAGTLGIAQLLEGGPSSGASSGSRANIVTSPCDTLFTYQCIEAEEQTFNTVEEAAAQASFEPALPAYIPAGFEPVAVRHTRPQGTSTFIQSEDYKRGCPGCSPREAHNDQIGVYYQNSQGHQLAIVQGFPAYIPFHDAAPEHLRGVVSIGEHEVFWVHTPYSPGTKQDAQQLNLYWDLGRVGTGWERHPNGTVQTGSPMSYSIASNTLSLEELVRIAESVVFD